MKKEVAKAVALKKQMEEFEKQRLADLAQEEEAER